MQHQEAVIIALFSLIPNLSPLKLFFGTKSKCNH